MEVFADLFTLHQQRKKPKGEVETFSGKELRPSDYTEGDIDTEDYGQVLVKFDDDTRGMVCISQISAGRKNHIVFEVNGTKKSLWWNHERPNELMVGNRNEPNQLMLKDAILMDQGVRDYAHFPGGHSEGYATAVKNFCRNVYRYIRHQGGPIDFATFQDGHNANVIVEAVLSSNENKQWVTVQY